MSKRNITYVKPQEPSFLAKLKAEIGYKEGPTVETKRQRLDPQDQEDYDSEEDSREDEQPQVVVLRPGDLSAEEAKTEKLLASKELAEKRADLTQPIVFKQRVKQPSIEKKESQSETNRKSEKSSTSKSKKSKAASSKLSFNEDEEDETPED
ncbi:uncharacterized protein KIAA1143 isoform X1 [Drosophila simulans]|uniref:GD13697 n=1 Tax=Drosophila simulans TaxID=7240 RepID=B4QNK2_DROSI|nr:uncharacterized protein KIAA1143 isoform X1 [Drosophila simulans]EDX08965.1 GD13697 [Drosophila simulans]KMY97167.1 uncharacterized protein Dsimw501_GD13697, isoform A [Drosophila simulans]